MQTNNFNEKAINDTYKNAHIALQSISDILPSVENAGLKKELKAQEKGYKENIESIKKYMLENNIEPKDINAFKKAMMWSSIKMKTTFNNSRNQIADMMLKGTVMGISELTQMKNENKNLDKNVLDLISNLLELEEKYEEHLKTYL